MDVVVDSLAWIPTDQLTHMQVAGLKAQLTMKPKKFSGVPGPSPQPYPLYREKPGFIGVPRAFFLDNKKPHHTIIDQTTQGRHDLWDGPLTFAGTLRPDQQEALDTVLKAFKSDEGYGGLVRAVTGWGKTVWSCAFMAALGVPTLVVVHKEFLVNQWKERIEQFLPGTKVGIVQQDRCEYKDCGVVIGMIHSLVGDRDYGEEFFGWPGLIITDETHRIGAETWSAVPTKFKARWRLGVSATPRRKDGCEDVFFTHIGKLLYASVEQRMTPKVRRVWTDFKLVQTATLNPSLVSKQVLLKFLCGNVARNRIIVEQLMQAVAAGRKPIVLSERLNHLDVLEANFRKEWASRQTAPVPSVGFYVGGQSEDDLEEAAKAQVIFATRQFAEEGLDIPALDTIFLTTPMSDVEQAVGRILRPCDGKKDPVVVDFRDDKVPTCAKAAVYRDKFYFGKGWK